MTNTLPLSDGLPAHLAPTRLYSAYIFDLDGTVYLGESLLPTAGQTIERLRALGKRRCFSPITPPTRVGKWPTS